MRLLLLLLLLLPSFPFAAAFASTSNIATTSRDSVSLISLSKPTAGGTVTLGLKFELAPGWHIYWSNPGDAQA